MYQLIAVSPAPETCECANDAYQPIEDLKDKIEEFAVSSGTCTYGDLNWAEGYRMEHLPVYTKTASTNEIQHWEELSTWRGYAEQWYHPLTLWLRVDLLHLNKD
jgi:hypothetical protein